VQELSDDEVADVMRERFGLWWSLM
jgi:hypothetical protein